MALEQWGLSSTPDKPLSEASGHPCRVGKRCHPHHLPLLPALDDGHRESSLSAGSAVSPLGRCCLPVSTWACRSVSSQTWANPAGRIDVAREASEGGNEPGPVQALRDAVIIALLLVSSLQFEFALVWGILFTCF